MHDVILAHLLELIRETFDGAKPGEGTSYLDHTSGIHPTLQALTAEQASRRVSGRPSIAAHARHMAFHLRVSAEWIEGDHRKRDWLGSFEPQAVNEAEWKALQADLDAARAQFERVVRAQSAEEFAREGAGFGSLAHLAYHLGAIRQLVHFL